MNVFTKQALAVVAAMAVLPAVPVFANSGLTHHTIAKDTPYKLIAVNDASAPNGVKFQIAPVKTKATAPAATTVSAAPVEQPATPAVPKTPAHPRYR